MDLQNEILQRFNQLLGIPSLIKSAPYEMGVGSITIFPEENIDEKLYYVRSIWTNKLRNLEVYIKRTLQILEKHQTMILHRFFSGQPVLFQPIRMEIEQLGAETHNGGECILKVTYYGGANKLGAIVYKPRSAETEIAILNMFSQLNALPKNKKTGPDLPVYQVVQLRGGKGSIWEFIEASAISFLASDEILYKVPNEHRKEAEINLMRLHSISKHIGLTDLHPQNILRRGPQWIPIDMEIIKQGAPTNLYTQRRTVPEPTPLALSEDEDAIIQDFLRSQPHRLSRLAPITTSVLLDLSHHCKGYQQTTLLLLDKLRQATILIPPETLENKIKSDFFGGDIPFFTEREDTIYYGVEKQAIACKKEDYATSSASK